VLSRRLPVTLACVIAGAGLAPATAAAKPGLGNWDNGAQRQVVRAGLMSYLVGRNFEGAARLTTSQANGAMSALAAQINRDPLSWGLQEQVPVVRTRRAVVTVTGFDAMAVDQLGLADVATHVQQVTAQAGLRPPSFYGTEVVARFLGLRHEQPVPTEQFDLFPTDQITRAEAAWSLAQILDNTSWSASYARETLSPYQLPAMTADQLTALRIAVSRIGYPYIWGGTTDNTADGLPHGGFDCSGFVWRVYKISGLPWGEQIHGRTAAQMAGEIARRQRLGYSQLRPGDILFFGSAHFNSTATEANIIHTGIYLGDNWVINSSDQGVYVLPLKGSWLGDEFAWGRRVLP
jgi:cell wall-associated NlpC family hydrolase